LWCGNQIQYLMHAKQGPYHWGTLQFQGGAFGRWLDYKGRALINGAQGRVFVLCTTWRQLRKKKKKSAILEQVAILATQEAEIRRIMVWISPGEIVLETLSQKYLTQAKKEFSYFF
jgi:hypothetical protein